MCPEHVTRTPTSSSAVLLSRVFVCMTWPVYCTLSLEGFLVTWYGRISYNAYIYTFWSNFDTVLCLFLETGTPNRCQGIIQLLRLSGFCPYPLSFFLYCPFNTKKKTRLLIKLKRELIFMSMVKYESER